MGPATIAAVIRSQCMVTGGNTYYFQHHPLGSIMAITSSSGATEWTYTVTTLNVDLGGFLGFGGAP